MTKGMLLYYIILAMHVACSFLVYTSLAVCAVLASLAVCLVIFFWRVCFVESGLLWSEQYVFSPKDKPEEVQPMTAPVDEDIFALQVPVAALEEGMRQLEEDIKKEIAADIDQRFIALAEELIAEEKAYGIDPGAPEGDFTGNGNLADDIAQGEESSSMKMPTSEQCGKNLTETIEGKELIAFWHPQWGGYHGKAWLHRHEEGCFDVYVWHDGDFPYEDKGPEKYHYCNSLQLRQMADLADGDYIEELRVRAEQRIRGSVE